MKSLVISPVRNRHERETFLRFMWKVYKGDSNWVAPLLRDRRRITDAKRGPFFAHGQAEFFIARRGGSVVGTICTAEDYQLNQGRNRKDCVIGFFECLPDKEAAWKLFDTAAKWAANHNLDTLYGPFNFDYEDGYGVLIEGWEEPAAILCGHTPPYYQQFFEDYGFAPARGDNLAFKINICESPEIQKLHAMADRVRSVRNFKIRPADFTNWQAEIDLIYPMINSALAHLPDHRPWPRESLEDLFRPFLQIADPELILLAEEDGKAIGFFPGVPNLNEWLIHANGLRYPWDVVSLWRHSRHQPTGLAVKSVLVYPEYWGTGVAILLFDELARRAAAKGYTWADLSLTSADNPKTPELAERLGARVYKRYRVYRKSI